VITGFRLTWGGWQHIVGIRPDLTCLGKIIGGGLPVGAFGGKREIMEKLSPSGGVYQAGTLSGNPLAMTAGIETLKLLQQPGFYSQLEEKSAALSAGIAEAAKKAGYPLYSTRVGSMFCAFLQQAKSMTGQRPQPATPKPLQPIFGPCWRPGFIWRRHSLRPPLFPRRTLMPILKQR